MLVLGALAGVLLGFSIRQALQRQERTIFGEVLAICGLSLTAPAAFYLTRGVWDISGFLLWLFCSLYFTSSVLYVKLRVSAVQERKPGDTVRLRWACGVYHAAMLAVSATRPLALAAFALVAARALWFVAYPGGTLNLKRIGWTEVVYSAVFLVTAGASLA